MSRPARLSPGITEGWWWLWWPVRRGTVGGCTVDAETLELALLTTGLRLVALDGAEVVA